MKTKLHQLIGTAMLGLALLSHSLPAWAGAVISDVVYISSNGTVRGSLTGARYGFYNTYIGCHHYRHAVQNTSFVACQAQDKYGRIALCTSTDQRIIDAVKGMTDSSHLLFRVSSLPQGTCTELTISNESVYLR